MIGNNVLQLLTANLRRSGKTHVGARAAALVMCAMATLCVESVSAQSECINPKGFELSKQSLKATVEAHARWLNDPQTGERAVLCNLDAARADFRGADLRQLDLRAANLPGADFRGANLSEALLHHANLADADFTGATLSAANLRKADLSRVDFSQATMPGVILRKSQASGAVLNNVNAAGADLSKVNFVAVNAIHANFQGAKLRKANLQESNLYAADLSDANLRSTNLVGANLEAAILTNADVTGSDFTGTNLEGVAIGTMVGLIEDQLLQTVRQSTDDFMPRVVDDEVPTPDTQASVDTGESVSTNSNLVDTPTPSHTSARSAQRFRVQIASFRDLNSAQRYSQTLRQNNHDLFDTDLPEVVSVDLGTEQGVWHRLQFGSFESKDGALAWCDLFTRRVGASGCFFVASQP